MHTDLLSRFPKVEALITDIQAANVGQTTDSVISDIREVFDREGPYQYAKRFGLLVNNSGEEFAVQWMSFYNEYSGSLTY
jgi:hypothetical protein